MLLDNLICQLPVIGFIFERMYHYFREHVFFTEVIHILFGLGIGLVLFRTDFWFWIGITFILADLLGHAWAFIQGSKS